MTGKVKCTCGWSWNKSDSSKKDMYICHECGRDNSNNMKNGGWLDNYGTQANYNDSKATASPDMRGDGYSNVGRKFSPAWGGQFEDGGEIPNAQKGKPIYVESKNDPRYRAYQDSLKVYNEGNSKYNNIKKTGYLKDLKVDVDSEKKLPFNKFIKEYGYNDNAFNLFNEGTNKNMKPISISHFRGDGILGYLDYGNQALYKKPQQPVKVKPTTTKQTTKPKPEKKRDKLTPIQNNLQPEGLVEDDFNLETELPQIRQQVRQPKYYDIQENINQPFGGSQTNYRTSDLNSITSPDDLGPGNTRKIIPHYQKGGKLKFLQPTSDKLPEGYRIPYSDPSTERAGTIGGENGEPAYLVPNFKYGHPIYDPVDEFRKTGEHLGGPFKTWQEADKWESETRHPAVEKGETIMFPQEKFAMGGSIPGSVGFSYARTQGSAPSNGKCAKKTMASAQNGQEMKYYQEGLDFKPKSISKNGGWLSKYDIAQNGQQVEYGTPEYREAYNRGEVVTDEGGRSPIQLDEVIVNKKSPAPGFWEQSKNRFLKNNQDSSVLGAIGAGVMYPFGIPQEAMMYGLTDKVQMPSEAIGFDNEESLFASPASFGKHASNFVLDAVTDPLNIVGAGILTKENTFSKLKNIPRSVAPELRQGLRTAGPSFNSSELFDLNNVRKPSGSIGNQGATSEGANKILQSLGIKVKGATPNEVTLKEMVEHLKNNPKDASKYKKFLEKEPISVSELPGGEYHINDGHHRATLSYYSGNESIPSIIKNKGEYIKQEDGGIIKDDRGQWGKHKGQPTRINQSDPESYIDMGPDPLTGIPLTEPLLGISDKGERKIMYPGEKHKYKKGTKYVDEFPMAKNGLRQEQKGLQNLDNLTNFTNYNKPQPGGWLNKYN